MINSDNDNINVSYEHKRTSAWLIWCACALFHKVRYLLTLIGLTYVNACEKVHKCKYLNIRPFVGTVLATGGLPCEIVTIQKHNLTHSFTQL